MPVSGPTAGGFFVGDDPIIGQSAYNHDFVAAQRKVAPGIEPTLLSPLEHSQFFPGGAGRTQAQAQRHGQKVGLRNLLRAHNREIHRRMDNYEPQWMPRADWAGIATRELAARELLPAVQGS